MIRTTPFCPVGFARLRAKPDRFWKKVAVKGPDDCWLWQAGKGERYGLFGIGRQDFRAHRVAFVLSGGQIPLGHVVCHSCDVPLCVNPAHLFSGTQAQNLADMKRKGRAQRRFGEDNPRTKLSVHAIGLIKEAVKTASYRKVGREFSVHHNTIADIVQGKARKILAGLPAHGPRGGKEGV